MYEYEMDPTRAVGATERIRDADAGRMDGRIDGQTEGVKPIHPPNNFVVRGGGGGGIMTNKCIIRWKTGVVIKELQGTSENQNQWALEQPAGKKFN